MESEMIEVNQLTKMYKSLVAVDDVSFSVKPGTITGFIGQNGAGKSTTLRCIVGLTMMTSGNTSVLGTKYSNLKNPSPHFSQTTKSARQNQIVINIFVVR
jgi:ABC-2 type transport system ATP-binding protein